VKGVRWLVFAVLAFAGIGGLIYALLPKPIPVEMAEVVRGPFEETVDDDGKTRVRERYVVSAPIAGTLLRIRLKAGDPVEVGTVLASIVPDLSPLLDPRTRQELEQRLGAAEARKMRTAEAVERAKATLDQAQADLERTRVLAAKGVAPQSKLERDEILARIGSREFEAARFEDHAAEHELELARAALRTPARETEDGSVSGETWDIRSPVTGRVLRILQKSEASVAIGAPLLVLGDPRDLEVVIDVLSTDAVRIAPGAPVTIERWGGDKPLEGRVRRVEPSAFTKTSALGVEEQRTNVIIDIVSPQTEWSSLGDGYRVDARIVVYLSEDAVKVPTGALFRDGDRWAAYVDTDGTARRRSIMLSRRAGLEAAVEAGLQPGEQVIVFPSDAIRDGVRVSRR
jgi:HlyD family secretion protein